MSSLLELKKHVINTFKISGFNIRSDPALFLAGLLLPIDDQDEQEKWLEDLTSHIQNQGLTIPNIEKSNIELAIKECGQSGSDDSETIFNVINAFDVPRYKYHQDRKKFLLNNTPTSILPEGNCKVDYLRDRYTMLWQRTSRHDLFSPAVLGTSNSSVKKFQLKKIETLLATSRIDEVVVLGLLTQLEEGKFYLEDPSGVVKLDLTNVQFHSGLFCEGCYVLADGKYKDGILRVSGLGFPPPELANSSRAYFGTQNTWGGPSKTLLKYSQPLAIHERDNRDALMVFLSDCWLDHPLVLDKLNQLFIGYDDCPPVAIVLMGPFAKNSDSPYFLKKKFQLIGETLGTCENLKRNTDIILVPSIEDPAAPNILPRPPLPEFLVADLKKKYPRIILATNPVRLQYCTQQIVVCRADLVTKLCRNALQFPSNGPLSDHFARTLICQGTLAPLHPIAMPTYWGCDSIFSLYPLPDLVVIGDPSEGFKTTQHGCTVLNTGSFPKSKFSFKVYLPGTKTVEDSEIPDDE